MNYSKAYKKWFKIYQNVPVCEVPNFDTWRIAQRRKPSFSAKVSKVFKKIKLKFN